MEATSQQGAVDLDEITARAEHAGSPLERARIRLEYFERGTLLTGFMEIWVADLELLLDAITMASDAPAVPTIVAGHVDASQIGLLGMSFGGGAVTAVCKEDARCRAAVNLDGGLWGSRMRQPLTVPYLVVAHPSNAAFFEHDLLISEAPYYAITVEGAAHTNFMDVSLFAPCSQWLGVTGADRGQARDRHHERRRDAFLRRLRSRRLVSGTRARRLPRAQRTNERGRRRRVSVGRLDAVDDAARRVVRIGRRPKRALLRHRVEITVGALLDLAPAPAERHEQRVAPLGLRRRLIERDALQRLAVQRADEQIAAATARACRPCTRRACSG